jgi:hypothetical protein
MFRTRIRNGLELPKVQNSMESTVRYGRYLHHRQNVKGCKSYLAPPLSLPVQTQDRKHVAKGVVSLLVVHRNTS